MGIMNNRARGSVELRTILTLGRKHDSLTFNCFQHIIQRDGV